MRTSCLHCKREEKERNGKHNGVVIQAKMFSSKNTSGLLKPIIYCSKNDKIEKEAISLNMQLARELLKIQPRYRTTQIEKYFAHLLATFPDDCVIKDFDVLFNPTYKIDVLMIMVNTCKTKPFRILWPGSFDKDRLIYAEEGYPDYKEYYIRNYDVTCIV